MIKKLSFTIFLLFSCVFVSFSQNTGRIPESGWEFMEVSYSGTACKENDYSYSSDCRRYNYLTSEAEVIGPRSLQWMQTSGWELVSVLSYEQNPSVLYFKRRFDKLRTDKEIKWLKEEGKKIFQAPKQISPPDSVLLDLDQIDFQQKIDEFNKIQESELKAKLGQIKNLPLKIISIKSNSRFPGRASLSAEIILDATSVLLKDGNKYRASEAEKYFRESVSQILNSIGVDYRSPLEGFAENISKSSVKPLIGNFDSYANGISLKISVVVNQAKRQNVVARATLNASDYKIIK